MNDNYLLLSHSARGLVNYLTTKIKYYQKYEDLFEWLAAGYRYSLFNIVSTKPVSTCGLFKEWLNANIRQEHLLEVIYDKHNNELKIRIIHLGCFSADKYTKLIKSGFKDNRKYIAEFNKAINKQLLKNKWINQ